MFLPATFLGLILVGWVFKKFDRKNAVILAVVTGFLIMESFFVYFIFIKPSIQEKRVRNSAITAIGKITSVEQTGTYFNHNPEAKITFEIYYPQGTSYEATEKMVIHQIDIPKFAAGTEVKVHIDKSDKMNFLVEGLNFFPVNPK